MARVKHNARGQDDITHTDVVTKIRSDIDDKITPAITAMDTKLDRFIEATAHAQGQQKEFEKVVKNRLKNLEGTMTAHEGAIGKLTGTIETSNHLLTEVLPILSKAPTITPGVIDKVSVRLSLVIILVSVLGVVMLGAGLSGDDIKAIRDIVTK